MTTPNRGQLFVKIHKVLKRTYKYTPTKGERPLLETLLLAACLENTKFDAAQAALERVRAAFFDWNEVRVSTVKELAELLVGVADPMAAAARLKGVLQSVFESDYSFELEHLKKQNLGAAIKRLQKLQGATAFNVAYGTQMSLGGHAIPVDAGTARALYIVGAISEAEAKQGTVPGMERAIPKSKGQEFGALLHELGADVYASPFSQSVRELLSSIAPDAKDRFPKRTSKKQAAEPAPAAQPATAKSAADGKKPGKEKEAAKEPAKKPAAKASKQPAKPAKAAAAKKKPLAAARRGASKSALAKRKPR